MPAAGTAGWRGFPAHNRGLKFPLLIAKTVRIHAAPRWPLLAGSWLVRNASPPLLAPSDVPRPSGFGVPRAVPFSRLKGIKETAAHAIPPIANPRRVDPSKHYPFATSTS